MIGMTGESMSPRTRHPISRRPLRNKFEFLRSWAILRCPKSPALLLSPIMTRSAESACCVAGTDMAGA
eukprot:2266320-Pleurochrysis_carterae.AAC.1